MYVCICHGVTETQVRRAAEDGCREVHELSMRSGLGSGCGSCVSFAAELLAEHAPARLLPIRVLRAA